MLVPPGNSLPPLPSVEEDLFLDITSHTSIRQPGMGMNETYGDPDRLRELGAQMLKMAFTTHFFQQKPNVPAQQLSANVEEALHSHTIDEWMNAYALKPKIIFSPDCAHLVNDSREMRRFFETYVGAVLFSHGIDVVQTWISQLLDPSLISDQDPDGLALSGSQPPPPSYPPPGSPPSPINQSNSGLYNAITLSLVNERAAQKRILVTYTATSVGPSHAPTWTVCCLFDGEVYGHGTATTQKKAKEEAARMAYLAKQW